MRPDRPDSLVVAFEAACYRVETESGCFDLHVGEKNAAFIAYLQANGIATWSVLTAYNPGATKCPDAENARRHALLLDRVRVLGFGHRPACNHAGTAGWPSEPGLLLLQVSEHQACRLAREFSQLACVFGDMESVPRLLWT